MLCVIADDRSKDAWIAAAWKQEWEASGPTRVHRHVSDPAEGVKGGGHWTTLKQTAIWDRSIQSFHEEVGSVGQGSM